MTFLHVLYCCYASDIKQSDKLLRSAKSSKIDDPYRLMESSGLVNAEAQTFLLIVPFLPPMLSLPFRHRSHMHRESQLPQDTKGHSVHSETARHFLVTIKL